MTRINTIDMLFVEINNRTDTHLGNMNLLFRIPSTANGITKVIDKAAIVFEIIVKYLYDWKTLVSYIILILLKPIMRAKNTNISSRIPLQRAIILLFFIKPIIYSRF